MSEHMHSMTPGQRLDIKGPIPKYQITENKHKQIVMIAGGTGVTPMWQVARAIFKNPNDKTKVTLIAGNVTENDILLKKEWDELENTFPQRFRAFYTLDSPPKEWTQGKGFITKELLKTLLPEPKEDNIKIFVCGELALLIRESRLVVACADRLLQDHQAFIKHSPALRRVHKTRVSLMVFSKILDTARIRSTSFSCIAVSDILIDLRYTVLYDCSTDAAMDPRTISWRISRLCEYGLPALMLLFVAPYLR